jgi:LPXTG-site transpeptidase (sortase) family protein
VAFILAGAWFLYQFVHQQQQEGNAAAAQVGEWRQLVNAAAGSATGSALPISSPAPLPNGAYLLLQVPKLNKEMVAIDSDWSGLTRPGVSMVHYHGSTAPGGRGNMLVAFHREFSWREVDQVRAGDDVMIQAADGRSYDYRVDFVKVVDPSDVSLLGPTAGRDMTMITCDPWLVDNKRMIFRSHLVTGGPAPS